MNGEQITLFEFWATKIVLGFEFWALEVLSFEF